MFIALLYAFDAGAFMCIAKAESHLAWWVAAIGFGAVAVGWGCVHS